MRGDADEHHRAEHDEQHRDTDGDVVDEAERAKASPMMAATAPMMRKKVSIPRLPANR